MSIKPKADQTRWTLVLTARRSRTEPLVATKMIRFATKALAEAELAKAKDRGEPAYLLPPIEAWGGKDPVATHRPHWRASTEGGPAPSFFVGAPRAYARRYGPAGRSDCAAC